MSFRAFCAVTGVDAPDVSFIHPRDLPGRDAEAAIHDLRFYLDALVAAWERYLEIGGLPQAVGDWLSDRRVSDGFYEALWDVIHGDALAANDWAPAQTQTLLNAISTRISSPMNISDLATTLDALLYYRSATRAEIDFTAGWLDGVPYEGKYTEGAWLRETQTASAAYGRCVLATRNVTERVSDAKRQLLAIPAPMLALLIDPQRSIAERGLAAGRPKDLA